MGDLKPTVPGTSTEDDRRRIYIACSKDERLWQGEVLEDVPQTKVAPDFLSATSPEIAQSGTNPSIQIEFEEHPLVIVLSQDCDLEQDYKKRNAQKFLLHNVLLADVFQAKILQEKLHAEEGTGSNEWRKIKENHTPRFQFLNSVPSDQDASGEGLPALAIDFRRYFTIRTDELYERLKLLLTSTRCRLQTPYAEHLVHRFHSYHSRVPLPKEHRE